MGFDYNRQKQHGSGDSMWTSYSDLFLGLSIVFLLLYVTASLKQGTDGIRQQLENQKLVKEAEDLRQQIKVYETLKQDYLTKQASHDEQATYEELMNKLTLLQDEQKDEKVKLLQKAQDNDKKEQALNKYQQLIRNIINSNMIAKSRIKNRDKMIDQKEDVINEKTQEISGLEKSVQDKSNEIRQGETQIASLEKNLSKQEKALKNAYIAHKLTKKKYEQQQEKLREEAETRIASLKSTNAKTEQELEAVNSELSKTSSQLNVAETKVDKLGQENNKLSGELAASDQKHKSEIDALKGTFSAQEAKDRAGFEAQLAKEKLSKDQVAARQAQFKADADKRAGELAGQIAQLDKKYRDSQGALAKATENLNARKNIAKQIKSKFAQNGIEAEVDGDTGDVMLSFGDQYFDTGRADLKPKMQKILESAMPAYSASLFENAKIAKKIQSVEIVGFASPTYQGKYVDPSTLDPDNRQAVNYNLDLSYKRAKSIFNYVFDRNKISFKDQDRMLPLVKVTGRSFLAGEKSRDPATKDGSEGYCRKNDCAKLQKVIIKFTLKD